MPCSQIVVEDYLECIHEYYMQTINLKDFSLVSV